MKKIILIGSLIVILGVAGYFFFFKPKPQPTFSKEAAKQELQKHIGRKVEKKYYLRMASIYEKILEAEPTNDGAKKELAKIYSELSRLALEESDKVLAKEQITKALAFDPKNAKALELSQKLNQH